MFGNVTWILQWLAFLGVCNGLAERQTTSHYSLVQRRMAWVEAREFCQRHYVDLAVLSTQEQYVTVLKANASINFWLGLQRQSIISSWKWVNGEELGYKHWYNNYEGCCCASWEPKLEGDQKLLARLCDELHMVACQGPMSPQSVTVDSVGADHVALSWNVSAFMQMTPHRYNVTICDSTCKMLFFSYTDRSAFMNVNITNLTSATEYSVNVAAFVVRPDNITGGKMILQNDPTTLQVKTADSYELQKILHVFLKLLQLMSLAPPLWILYKVVKKDGFSEKHDVSPAVLSTEDTVDLIPQISRAFV